MKILTGKQIKELDSYTIEHEPVESIDLMERAAELVAQAICNEVEQGSEFVFFIGKGNNGGDGLAVARMLSNVGFGCSVVMLYPQKELSEECAENFNRLSDVVEIQNLDNLSISEDAIIVDAILGSGVVEEVKEPARSAIGLINSLPNRVIAIDLPSGMHTEFGNNAENIVCADTTLALEFPKLAMMLPEAGDCCGDIKVLPIELSEEYQEQADSPYEYVTEEFIAGLIRPRAKFAHKNSYGHALLVCGSHGMCGAAILAASGALRSGCGLVTAHIPEREAAAMYASSPSAILSLDKHAYFSTLPLEINKYASIGVGCGIGTEDVTGDAIWRMLYAYRKPIVFDADALKIVAERKDIQSLIPAGSVFTPHLGELKCLVGEWSGEEDKLRRVREFASRYDSTVVVKGAHTMICTPDGRCYFNSTGTPGMAKGGSGDVLTGYITGLIARGYSPEEAAVVGVYMHGKAGEKAADYYGEEGMNSSDLADFIAEAMSEFKS